MATALITGASGFIGGHLAEALVGRGHHVRCLVRRTSAVDLLQRLDVELVYGDVTDPESLRRAAAGVDVVYHLAAMTSALRAADLMRVNAEGAAQVARACARQSNPPVHLLASSVAAAGPARHGRLRSESDRPAPISNYGHSKRAGELAAEAWADEVPTTVVRPGIVFGERNREMLPMFRTIARFRIHPIAGFASPPLSLIHVEDLVEIMLRAADRGARIAPRDEEAGGRGRGYYFACAPEYPNYAQLGRIVRRFLGRPRALLVHIAEPFPWVIAGISELLAQLRGRPDSLNIDKIREATAVSWACSPAAVQRELDFEPPQALAERLRATVQWYRDNGWL